MTAVLSTDALSKDYGPVRVVSGVSLEFHAGSIHALLGENGAGKSTLIGMLAGARHPSEGHVLLDGHQVRLRSVKDAQGAGIVALPQELVLVGSLGAAENIFLGMRRPGQRGIVNRRQLDRDARGQLARLGVELDVDVPVAELSAVQQTMVALARALARDARVLILDEPTAALTDTETEQLFAVLRQLRQQGTAIIYVSHRLEEVFDLADRITVMRNGLHIWTKPVQQTHTDDVFAAMLGRPVHQAFPDRTGARGRPLLRVENLTGHTLHDVTLEAHAGRVLGIAGLAGSGRSELLRLIAGAEAPRIGTVLVNDRDVTRLSVARRLDLGIGYVPEERRSQGLVMNGTVASNIALGSLRALSRLGVMDSRSERATARTLVADLRVRTTSVHQPVVELSGGNQQKVVLAKYLARRPDVLLLDEPTRGIDVGTKAEIYQLVRRLADEGVAVVMVSSEIPELLGVADDIAVVHEGRLTGIVPAADSDEEAILHLCYRKPA